MKISTKGRYALRLMLDLALNDSEEPTRIKEYQAVREYPVKYLEQIIAILNKARYVRSIRGPQGGISADKKAGRIHSRHDFAPDRRQYGTG